MKHEMKVRVREGDSAGANARRAARVRVHCRPVWVLARGPLRTGARLGGQIACRGYQLSDLQSLIKM
ncbi:hypothetical protein, partial [Trinickia sp.]|uniref:hypothetical protein n=1 Tax=Trinickia sp. TaxID=2571163 RepID=UPI003F80F2EB